MDTVRSGKRCWIGPFVLDASAEILLRGSDPVPLGRRAVALLELLVDRSGWIETLPRRGYRFVGPVQWHGNESLPAVPAPVPDELPSLAVLPFRASGPNAVPDYVTDALTEDTIAMLAGLPELTVISHGSTMRFRDIDAAARIGCELGATYLVGGSVRMADGRLRISVELSEASTGVLLSARAYEGADEVRLDALDCIVAQIVRMIAPGVRKEELRRIRLKRPENLAAYDLIIQAR